MIVINLHTAAHSFKISDKDSVIGCRLNVIERKYDEFLQKLKRAGAKLIFVFRRSGSNKDLKFVERFEFDLLNARKLTSEMTANNNLEHLVTQHKKQLKLDFRSSLPLNEAVFFVLCQVAQRHGIIHGMESSRSRVSKYQIDLANDRKAMAVLGSNSYYFLLPGQWALWSDRDLNMDTMTTHQYNRNLALDYLNITYERAPLFAALAGGLNTYETSRKVVKFFRPWEKHLFKNVSDFVNSQRYPITDYRLTAIIRRILGNCPVEVYEDFKKSIESISSNTLQQEGFHEPQKETSLTTHIKDDFANLAEEIFENFTVFISPVYLDER